MGLVRGGGGGGSDADIRSDSFRKYLQIVCISIKKIVRNVCKEIKWLFFGTFATKRKQH